LEGFPNVVLEALADGTPVIATDVGDVRSLIEDGVSGWVTRPGDPAELAEAIRRLAQTTREERRAMGNAGSEHVLQTYPSSRLAADTMGVYQEILESAT
jgi:galacturonosyltransferase